MLQVGHSVKCYIWAIQSNVTSLGHAKSKVICVIGIFDGSVIIDFHNLSFITVYDHARLEADDHELMHIEINSTFKMDGEVLKKSEVSLGRISLFFFELCFLIKFIAHMSSCNTHTHIPPHTHPHI